MQSLLQVGYRAILKQISEDNNILLKLRLLLFSTTINLNVFGTEVSKN